METGSVLIPERYLYTLETKLAKALVASVMHLLGTLYFESGSFSFSIFQDFVYARIDFSSFFNE